jgi:hypothetical protein
MSQYPKLLAKMNGCLHHILTYFEAVIHPAAGKDDVQKNKRRNSKPAYYSQVSPDSLHIRASLRTQNAARRNPAP